MFDKNSILELERLVKHESGHVLVAYAIGVKIFSLKIKTNNLGIVEGIVNHGLSLIQVKMVVEDGETGEYRFKKYHDLFSACVILQGGIAATANEFSYVENIGDALKIHELIEEYRDGIGDLEVRNTFFNLTKDCAILIVDMNREPLQKFSDRVFCKAVEANGNTTLSGQEIEAFLRTMSIPNFSIVEFIGSKIGGAA